MLDTHGPRQVQVHALYLCGRNTGKADRGSVVWKSETLCVPFIKSESFGREGRAFHHRLLWFHLKRIDQLSFSVMSSN